MFDRRSEIDTRRDEIIGDRQPGPNEVLGTAVRITDYDTSAYRWSEGRFLFVPWNQARNLWKSANNYSPERVYQGRPNSGEKKPDEPWRPANLQIPISEFSKHDVKITTHRDGIFRMENVPARRYIVCPARHVGKDPATKGSGPAHTINYCTEPLELDPPEIVHVTGGGQAFYVTKDGRAR